HGRGRSTAAPLRAHHLARIVAGHGARCCHGRRRVRPGHDAGRVAGDRLDRGHYLGGRRHHEFHGGDGAAPSRPPPWRRPSGVFRTPYHDGGRRHRPHHLLRSGPAHPGSRVGDDAADSGEALTLFEREDVAVMSEQYMKPPASGEKITFRDGKYHVPDNPIIPFIEGDGTGPDIWAAAVRVLDAAVEKAYGGTRKIAWYEVLAGEKAYNLTGTWLPQDTLDAIAHYRVGIKGPLTTPVGGGIRSL